MSVKDAKRPTRRIEMNFRVVDLPSKRNFLKKYFSTSYFLQIFKGDPTEKDVHQIKMYESDLFVDEFDKEFRVEFTDEELCDGDFETKFEIRLVHRNLYMLENKEFASAVTTVARMQKLSQEWPIPLIEADSRERKAESARISVINEQTPAIRVYNLPNMVDYLRAGYQVNLIAAIDFTFSNGHASNPSSLHYVGAVSNHDGDQDAGEHILNPYSEALQTVGRVLSEYDSD